MNWQHPGSHADEAIWVEAPTSEMRQAIVVTIALQQQRDHRDRSAPTSITIWFDDLLVRIGDSIIALHRTLDTTPINLTPGPVPDDRTWAALLWWSEVLQPSYQPAVLLLGPPA